MGGIRKIMVLWRAVFLAASPLVTAPPSNLTRTYYNGSTAKSHSTTTQYRQLRRLEFYLSFSLSITDAKNLCHESSRELEKPEMPKRGREKPWLGKTNSGARLFDSGSLFRFVSNTFQPGFFFTSTLWKIFILVSCNDSVSRFVPRWRLKDSLPEAPVLHKTIVIFQAWTTCGHIFLFDNAVFLALVFTCRCRRMHQEKAT